MEDKLRWSLVTAVAPVAWGSTYFVTQRYLPADHALWGALLRALPAGLLLLVVCRQLPTGRWWWRSLVLGTLNNGAFFVLVYLSAQLLPSSVASTVMATSPVMMTALAWALLGERPQLRRLAGSVAGIAGVVLMVAAGAGAVDGWGVAASVAAMVMSSLGFVLAKRWSAPGESPGVLPTTAWQLAAGGLVLAPVALLVEGAPPVVDTSGLLAYAYVAVIATAVAFACWFAGLAHLDAAAVGLIGLLNPVTGVLLGTVLAAEVLTPAQVGGLVLVLGGILVGQRLRAGREPAPAPVVAVRGS